MSSHLKRFFYTTLIWSYIFWCPVVLQSNDIISISFFDMFRDLLLILGFSGPIFGAVFTLKVESGDRSIGKHFRSFLNFNLGWKGYLYPVIILGSIIMLSWFIPELFGYQRLSINFTTIIAIPLQLISMMLIGGGQEEIGWRGYALPRLEKQLGIWKGNIVLGLIWSIWHLPLWFISGNNQVYMNFGVFALGAIGLSFFMSWHMKISKNKPFSAIFSHGLLNYLVLLIPNLILGSNKFQLHFLIQSILFLITGFFLLLNLNSRNKA